MLVLVETGITLGIGLRWLRNTILFTTVFLIARPVALSRGSFFPGAEASVHAVDLRETLLLEERGSALTSDAMIAIDDMGAGLVGCSNEFFDIGIIYADGTGDMGYLVRLGVADIDEDRLALGQFFSGCGDRNCFYRLIAHSLSFSISSGRWG